MSEPQNADGTPHYAYFDYPTQLSFIWDGESRQIQVCWGGYGEPVIDTIAVNPALMGKLTALGWAKWFQAVCNDYLNMKAKT